MGAAAGAGSCQGTSIGAPPSPGVGGRIQGARACELDERLVADDFAQQSGIKSYQLDPY